MSIKSDQIHFFSWDDRRDIAHPGDYKKTVLFSIEHFANCAKEAIRLHGHFAVALSGGSTPKAIFETLSKAPYSSEIDWSKVLLFWSDERNKAPTHPDSNFRIAMESGFKNLPISAKHIFRMKAEHDIEANALDYENVIKKTLNLRPFDLIMLGMGEDGHTASLFPETNALSEEKRWVVANYVPQKKMWRMTMTFPLINMAKNIVIYVLGKNKREMIRKVFLDSDSSYPISRVGTSSNKSLWILDTEACTELFEAKSKPD